MKTGRLTALAATTALASLGLTACQTGSAPEPGPEMGNAVAAASPESVAPAGRVIDVDTEVIDLAVAGETIALRSAESLQVGTLADFDAGEAETVEIPAACADLTASADTFVLACGSEVLLVDAASPTIPTSRDVSDNAPASSASLTTTGELLVGNAEESVVSVHRDGEDADTIDVAGTTDQLLAVPVNGAQDVAVRSNIANTTVQDIHWEDGEQGGTLRVGVGVGQIAAGEDGLVIASDTLGDQIAVYTATDVIRLHQTAPVDASPWGVAWDPGRDLAWVASTADNVLASYDISSGVPEQVHTLNSVPDAHHIAVLPDGTLVAVSATGDGLQVIDDPAAV